VLNAGMTFQAADTPAKRSNTRGSGHRRCALSR
jgi:hypothetical protein